MMAVHMHRQEAISTRGFVAILMGSGFAVALGNDARLKTTRFFSIHLSKNTPALTALVLAFSAIAIGIACKERAIVCVGIPAALFI
jgi:hypothetical protein